MATLAERIENLSIPEPNSGCWLWLGNVNRQGYGQIMMGGQKKQKAHRVSWLTYRGPIPQGLHVLHRCDVTCCVNPEHLFVGTRSVNMLDMYAKGRHRKVFLGGSAHHRSKLTDEDVRFIRSTPKHTRGLAAKFGVSNSRISAIRNGINWKHLGD